jgi:hypothetical protein
MITADDLLLRQVTETLEERYGAADFTSDRLSFDWTDYYRNEMGTGLFRRFVTFHDLIARERLVDIKRETNEVEERVSQSKKRRINIDPGYISAEHLILATTKGYTHRPYLSRGIYADLTLVYAKGEFQPLPWTYPDYASDGIRQLLKDVRRRYVDDLKRS